ncbi:MAG TPA: Hsp20/alpha crystallin family protein [Tepidisphaeraceae bacterium]|jgi:HSP20 family molecular chaperone IbpA
MALPTHVSRSSQYDPAELAGREFDSMRFLRSFSLPPTVDEQSCNANLKEGVLTITLNKREETKPRKVQVQ